MCRCEMCGLWVCTCVECIGIEGVYMCGVPRDCGCVAVEVANP